MQGLADITDNSEKLRKIAYNHVRPFMLKGTFDCKVVRVFDGDTVWVAIRVKLQQKYNDDICPTEEKESYWRVCCRLLGIDTPEMPRSHADAMQETSVKAFAARDRLVELVTDVSPFDEEREHFDTSDQRLPSLSDGDLQRKIDSQNTAVLSAGLEIIEGTDKYGRYLARLKTRDGRDASAVLLEEGHAVPYGSVSH